LPAYLIRAHQRPGQVVRLVDRLSTPGSTFHVFVSARTPDDVYAAMRRPLAGRDDVHWVERIPAYYSGFSLVRSTLAGLASIAGAGPLPSHVVILSGQDYPLRPAAEIEELLAARTGESLVEHFHLPSERWGDEDGGLDRVRYRHFERIRYRTRILRLPFPRRSFPAGLEPYGGSAWCALSDEAVRTLLAFEHEQPEAYRFFAHVRTPDEMFIQTVLLNSRARERVANESIHHIEWPGGSHPATFRRQDFPRLAASGKPFARKFDTEVDAEVLDLIDTELLGQASGGGG
jgi:hypothetical protein